MDRLLRCPRERAANGGKWRRPCAVERRRPCSCLVRSVADGLHAGGSISPEWSPFIVLRGGSREHSHLVEKRDPGRPNVVSDVTTSWWGAEWQVPRPGRNPAVVSADGF